MKWCIEFCKLHISPNVRYPCKATFRHSFVTLQGLKVFFKPNSMQCFLLARNPATMLQIRDPTYENCPQSLNYTFAEFFFICRCFSATVCNFSGALLVKPRFLQGLSYQTVPEWSSFEIFSSQPHFAFHRSPMSICCSSEQKLLPAVCWESLCTFRVQFANGGTFSCVVLRIWTMDTGLRARTTIH